MGICLSKRKLKTKIKGAAAGRNHCSSATPPTFPSEEEAVVKQVLTETPTVLPRPISLVEDRSYEASESCSFSESFVSNTPSEADEISAKSILPQENKCLHRRRQHPQQPQQRRRHPPPALRRDAGERSGRRSRSPSAIRRDAGERSGRMPTSPAPLWKDNGERSGRRSASPATKRPDDRRVAGVSRSSSMRKAAPPAHLDSMENPLVSLECFIFL